MSVVYTDRGITYIPCADSVIRQVSVNNQDYLSIKDAIKFLCITNNKHACQIWRLLHPDLKEELKEHLNTFTFPGSGGEMRDVITFQGLRELVMMLPGSAAKRSRLGYIRASGEVLDRVLEGDDSLHQVIDRNKYMGVTHARVPSMFLLLPSKPSTKCRRPTLSSVFSKRAGSMQQQVMLGQVCSRLG